MDLESKILSCLKTNPSASEDELLEILSTGSREDLEKMRKLKGLIPFMNLHTALERHLTSLSMVIPI
jgi:hypothetical protein